MCTIANVQDVYINDKRKILVHHWLMWLLWINALLIVIRMHSLYVSGWPSGLRRQTQGMPCIVSMHKCSGPRMWAWVQIPLLTKFFFFSFVLYYHAVLIFAVGITCVHAYPILQLHFNFIYKCVMSYLVLLRSDRNDYVVIRQGPF